MATDILTGVEVPHQMEDKKEKRGTKRKSPNGVKSGKSSKNGEANNNMKKQKFSADSRDDMLAAYQPWVIQTYGDLAKTKTITLKKYARILRTLRGEEVVSADNSKFRFWVKAKGFHVGRPAGYDPKPADSIVGRFSVCDIDEGIPPISDKMTGSARDPPLYVPNAPFKNSIGDPVYRKVAVVENFFDIIYNVHVELEGRPGKHAGQKRTYRTITETYAFLPREAVTRFLLGCTECQKHPRSPSPSSVLPTPSPSPTLPLVHSTPQPLTITAPPIVVVHNTQGSELTYLDLSKSCRTSSSLLENCSSDKNLDITKKNLSLTQAPQYDERQVQHFTETKKSSNPLDVCNLTSKDPPKSPPKLKEVKSECTKASTSPTPKLWSPLQSVKKERENSDNLLMPGEIDYSMPITTTYLKYMRSLGCSDEDALKFEKRNENLPNPESLESNEDDQFIGGGSMKDTDKLKLMLLAWNYHNQSQGNRNCNSDVDLSSVAGNEEMAGLWAQYQSALGGFAKGKATPPSTRDQSSPVNAETGSAHDETSSSGNKEDEDDDDDESDDKIDTQTHDPERLKAFNMFVRLFVDENLDRMVPISKQPKEKIQAIIDSCTRQFPEFAERARKRIRTYLKSCRRNKRARDPNSSWDATRPTPAHLTSVQAEQILATACENESHNAKRMRLGLEPVSQPMPIVPGTQPTDTTAPISRGLDFSSSNSVKMDVEPVMNVFPSSTTPSSTSNAMSKSMSITSDIKTSLSASNVAGLGANNMNGIGISSTAGSLPTNMYRPNFTQAFQRSGPYPLFPGSSSFSSGGASLLTNDLSMKQKPLINHKLSTGEMAAVRQLITGYRESAAFLLRSADELEQLLVQQQ
ncbi:nucleolar protein 4 isoform X2 [Coccinella septempunctata]|uniref:nucleolar protein 4 isoform X2 n=1 Tax=Coccinella septempunctata TaxID=41139 RepID=UPI001D07FAF4|nr:nucleolar protein 4 isoform X2 [Coccinella septempunctata]